MTRKTTFVICICALFCGCKKDEITMVRVPKEAAAPTMPMAGMSPPGMPNAPSSPELPGPSEADKNIHWTTPSSWTEEAPSQFRVGSFKAKGPDGELVDIAVTPLSGGAGGLLPNVNRWRGQIQLQPLSESELNANIKKIKPAGRDMTLVSFSNQGRRVTAAIYERGDQTWFFKMSGADKAVQSEAHNFEKFLSGLKFDEAR